MERTFGQAFGELVRTKRGQEGLTQKELAIRAFDNESKVRRINDLETGAVNRPHVKTVDALVVALDIRGEELATCRLNNLFTAQEEAGIGLSRQLMENLSQRFDHENPNAPDDGRREIYLTRSIHAHEVALAMSDGDDVHTSDAQFGIGLAFFLHAEIAEKGTAISDLGKALVYYEAALPGYRIDGRKNYLKKLESARTETKTRLKKLQTSQEASGTQSPSPS
jgi:transcriptional regulator with XRE-family HTH domain